MYAKIFVAVHIFFFSISYLQQSIAVTRHV